MKRNSLLLALPLLATALPLRADITNNLIAYYNFENLTGVVGETVVDQSGHGHSGVCRQDQSTLKAPTIVAGPNGLGDALNFDGGFYVQIPNHSDFDITDNITVAAWVSVDAFDQDWQTMFCRGDWSWRLHREGSSDYGCFHMSGLANGYGADGAITNIRVPKRWLHLVATYRNGTGATLYINGAVEASNASVSGFINTSGNDPVTIGAQIDNGVLRRQWRGQLDDVRLYNRTLTAADVTELYAFTQTNYNSRPLVTMPSDLILSGPTNIQLTATASDDGQPLPSNPPSPDPNDPHKLRWSWSVVSVPATSSGVVWSGNPTNGEAFTYSGSPNPPGTIFTCNPTATFDTSGIYTLRFSANDGDKGANQTVSVWVRTTNDYRSLGYMYLSPLPAAEYTSPQTRFVLVRFQNVSPNALTNLSSFIQVTGKLSGPHAGLTKLARDNGNHFNGFNTHYQLITNYWAVNGYSVDEHELQVLADGTYFLVGLRTETVDMSRYVIGGNTAASVTEQTVQQFTPAGELIFQWRAWEHLDVRDQQQFINILGSGFDFPHMNAIDVDTDGNILLSARNTSEVTKINRDNGDIIWRLGGVHNQFTFVNDPLSGTRNQHAIRMVTTNRYTIFDNGNLHSPSESRAVEYLINTTNMTATDVWQYPNPATPSIYSFYMGNAQRLTNGNTLINWAVGNLPKLTEVRPDGTKAFEMNWVDQWEAYRTWRCPWQGSALQPYLILEPYPDNLTLIFNQFGDTNVAFYRIYGGTTPQPTNWLADSGVTLKRLSNIPNGSTYYFRVTAVSRQGIEGPYSNETNATINIIKPGQNMMVNGDFSSGTNSWVWTLSGGATAAWVIESGVSHVYITNGTAGLANIQLKQTGKAIVQGKKYVFEFDAWSTAPRYIDAKVAQDAAPNLNYSGTTSTFVTPTHNHFRYVFTMTATTDFNASVFFNMGSSPYGVWLDNVSLYYVAPGDLNTDNQVDYTDLKTLTSQWLQGGGGLTGDLDGSGRVDFKDFGIFGENWSGGN